MTESDRRRVFLKAREGISYKVDLPSNIAEVWSKFEIICRENAEAFFFPDIGNVYLPWEIVFERNVKIQLEGSFLLQTLSLANIITKLWDIPLVAKHLHHSRFRTIDLETPLVGLNRQVSEKLGKLTLDQAEALRPLNLNINAASSANKKTIELIYRYLWCFLA